MPRSNSSQYRPPVVCLTGPESTGKTTLANSLATSLQLPLISEAARDLMVPGKAYDQTDLQEIAAAQQLRERAAIAAGAGAVLDTDVLVIAVWWRVRFAKDFQQPWPPWLTSGLRARTHRQYLLCQPDLDWQPDPLRESPHDRDRLLLHYQGLLQQGRFPWSAIGGKGAARLNAALEAMSFCWPWLSR